LERSDPRADSSGVSRHIRRRLNQTCARATLIITIDPRPSPNLRRNIPIEATMQQRTNVRTVLLGAAAILGLR
jgi:hypothetical protein